MEISISLKMLRSRLGIELLNLRIFQGRQAGRIASFAWRGVISGKIERKEVVCLDQRDDGPRYTFRLRQVRFRDGMFSEV